MKKILSLTLAVLMVVSMIPTAFAAEAGGNWAGGTQVEATGTRSTVEDDGSVTHNAEYTITVPALLAPGGSGTVTLEGYWPSDATVKVTAEEKVEVVSDINSADKKELAVTFASIEKAGSNTAIVTASAPVSVANIENALFGKWAGKFNYNVDYVAGSGNTGDSGSTGDGSSSGDVTDLNPDDGTTPADGAIYAAGDYKYTYKDMDAGWSVKINEDVTDKNQTSYGAILESINGVPVTIMANTFQNCTNLATAPVIPASITNMTNTFSGCTGLTGTVEINANPTQYGYCFYGVDFAAQDLTLTGASTKLDDIVALGSTNYCDDCNGACQENH